MGGLQTPLFCGCFKWLLGPVAVYTGCVPGVFVQDVEFLCTHDFFFSSAAPVLVLQQFDDFGIGDASI